MECIASCYGPVAGEPPKLNCCYGPEADEPPKEDATDEPEAAADPSLKTVFAPPGKMGVTFNMDMATDCAVVTAVRDESSVRGLIGVGDQVLEVDGEDTSKYTHEQLAAHLQGSEGSIRKLTIKVMHA